MDESTPSTPPPRSPPLAKSSPGKVIQFYEREMPPRLQARISHALKYGRDATRVPMDPAPVKRD